MPDLKNEIFLLCLKQEGFRGLDIVAQRLFDKRVDSFIQKIARDLEMGRRRHDQADGIDKPVQFAMRSKRGATVVMRHSIICLGRRGE